MTAATAAAKWLAARRLLSRSSTRSPFGQGDRLVLFAPALLSGAVILCAAIGFAVTQLSANHIAVQEHAALQRALDAFQGATGDVQDVNDTELRLLEHSAGLKDLRFDVGPANEAGREMQSLHDARGRIIGWFSWIADNALAHAIDRLWGLLAVVGAVFGVVSFVAAWVSQRPPRSLDRRAATARKPIGHDTLTGLPNQRAMIEHLDDALAQRRLGAVVFILVDLDGFHEVNDALGRAGGDAVMMNVAEHLRTGLPAGAMLGRFEEDEFAVIASGDDRRTAAAVVDTLRASLQRPIFVDRMWQITAGVGVAEAPEDGTTSDELARRAGLALRAAKREGRGRLRLFEPQIETEYAERRSLLRELQSAISLQTFDVHYQPIVAADGGAMVGVEALLRWTHPSRGPIPPAVFIPLAEQSGMMSQLGEIVLRRALADASRWPALSVAVNLSPLQIRDRWLVDLVGAVMSETGIASSRVVLEVTEGILIDNPQEALTRLEALRALGVSLALDDFGTGFSSLNYLQKFPFDRLKIDRAFVASLGTSGSTGPIIQAIVTLGHALGMKVLAEGVETDEQRVLLRLAGCDEMQGYLFARPGPVAEIDRVLTRVARSAAG
ncbi:MAG: bifunctional diguanylate cyclase/phosphodiesterase [Xanthobacteraceae bacterium]